MDRTFAINIIRVVLATIGIVFILIGVATKKR